MRELDGHAGGKRLRRRLSLLTFGLGLVVLSWGGAGVPTFASSGGYAPPALAIDDPSPDPGGPVTFFGSGCEPGSTVSFSLEPGAHPLGTTTADTDGRYRYTASFPTVGPGTYTIVAACGPTRTTTEVTVSAPAPAQPGRADDPGGDRPRIAFTGARVAALVATSAVLLALGVAALVSGRRWRQARA